jgi:antitoxin HicB
MRYLYTAVFTPTEDGTGYYASVPDLEGCITTGDTLQDAIEQITDAASIWLVCAEDDGATIAPPTPQAQIKRDPGAICSLIQVDTFAYRAAIDTKAVRKNVSLPAWLANLADQRHINVSQVLQDALKAKLEAC